VPLIEQDEAKAYGVDPDPSMHGTDGMIVFANINALVRNVSARSDLPIIPSVGQPSAHGHETGSRNCWHPV
jgi:hypothetical protein